MTILVVDDEIGILKILRDIFEPRGWKVVTAPTGEAAFLNMEKEKIDIILLDIRLPDCSGLEVLKQIKAKYPSIPVIIYTAYGYEDELVNNAIRQGASGYVSKSVPIKELVEVVNNTMVK